MELAQAYHETASKDPEKRPLLKVLYITRATLFTIKGGDTTQVLQTAGALEKLSVLVDIRLCNDRDIDYSGYDLIHFFNIGHPANMMFHIRKTKLPYVVSTIYVDYSRPADRKVWSIKDLILNIFGRDAQEYIKTVSKALLRREQIMATDYLWMGHKRSVKRVISNASMLLPNSDNEYRRLIASYGIKKNYAVVPNAADAELFNCSPEETRRKDKNRVLCVARIELLKNQLNLIRALNNSPYQLYLVGDPAPHHGDYYKACRKISASNIHFISGVEQMELTVLYKKAKVHILPSWFETTGLASLEALYCGCNIVVTDRGDTPEYFDPAFCTNCDPSSSASIRAAVDRAASMEPDMNYIELMKAKCNWQKAASITLQAYQQVLLNAKP